MVQVEKYLQEFTDSMRMGLPGSISVSIVDLLDGKIIAYSASDFHADNREVSSYQADVVKYALKGMNYIDGLNTDRFRDITITLDNQIHIIFTSEKQRLIVHVIMEREGANLGLAEILKNKLYKELFVKLQSEASPEEIAMHPLMKPVDIFNPILNNINNNAGNNIPNSASSIDNLSKKEENGGFFKKLFSNN